MMHTPYIYPHTEPKVIYVSGESIIFVVVGYLCILPARLTPDVEPWHVFGWGHLRQHCTEHGGELREFLATILHRYRISDFLRTPPFRVLAAVMGLSSLR